MTTDLQNLVTQASAKAFNSSASLIDLVDALVKKVESLEEQNNLLATRLETPAPEATPLTVANEHVITDAVCKYLANMDLAGYIDFDSRETREKLQEAVSTALSDQIEDAVSSALSDQIEDAVSDAIGNVDLSDVVDNHIREFDFSDAIVDTLRYSLDLSEFFPPLTLLEELETKVETLEKQLKTLQSLKEDLKQTFAQTLLRHETEV